MSIAFSVFKPKFKKTIADAVYNEVVSGTAIYYHWLGKENLWTDFLSPFIPSSATDIPGQPSNNFRYDLHVRRDILTLKKIKPTDVSYVVKRINWESGTTYDMYDDAIETVVGYGFAPSFSGAVTLEESLFYVMTNEFKVYKCIWNNDDKPSTVQPTSTSTSVITTSDGYKWKFMYLIPVSLRNRFLTDEWMPITTAKGNENYTTGEIRLISIQNGGSGYSQDDTIALITGDGYQEYNPYIITDINVKAPVTGTTGGSGYLVTAGDFVTGKTYTIVSPGSTNFTLIGAANNDVGTTFTATGPGSLDGTAHLNVQITVEDPFFSAIEWTSGGSVDKGNYIKYTDTGITNFYLVVTGNNLGTVPPTHTGVTTGKGDTQSYTAGGGDVSLQYAGTKARASVVMSTSKDSIATINIIDNGIGYFRKPTIGFTPPFVHDSEWQPSYTGDVEGNIIKYQGRYYEVITEGLTSPVDGPTHLTGDVLNGTVEYRFLGQDPEFTPVIEKTNAEVTLLISPPKDSVFKFTVLGGGTKYSEVPTVTVAAPGEGSAATAVASITNGKVTAIQVDSIGNGYTSAPTVTVSTPKITFDGKTSVFNGGNYITYTSHKFATGDAVEYQNGGNNIGTLSDGTTYFVIAVDPNTIKLATTRTNAIAGTALAITGTVSSEPNHTLQLTATSEAAIAVSSLGTGGEIYGYVIEDYGIGYTNANVQIYDNSKTEEWNEANTGGAILTVDFITGNVETLQADVELLAVPGSIETFKIVNGGDGYAVATIEILGDGSGATAVATCSGGKVTKVEIVNPGIGYTWTDVLITGNAGASGAEVRAIMSPLGGHGSNAIDELNASSISFYTSISRDINQGLEVTNDYRKAGLMRNVLQFGSNRRFNEDTGSGCVLVTGKYNPSQLLPDMLLLTDEGTGNPADNYKKYRIVEFTDVTNPDENGKGDGQILLSVFNNFTIFPGDIIVTDPSNGGAEVDSPLAIQSIVASTVKERTIDQFSGDFLFFSVRESFAPTQEQIITLRTTLTI
jgi:hypothetical protein